MRRFALALALAAAVGMLACGGGDDDGDVSPSPGATITSDDGKATLTLPQGALPSGVTPGSVTLTRIEPGPTDTFLFAYRLEPDGTQLQSPATLRIDTFNENWGGGMVLHVSATDVESLDPTPLVDPVFGSVEGMDLSLAHFSDVAFFAEGFLQEPEIIVPLQVTTPGGTTTATVRVRRNATGKEDAGVINKNATGSERVRVSWNTLDWASTGEWSATNLSPDKADVGFPTSNADFQNFAYNWTCLEKGAIVALLYVKAEFSANVMHFKTGATESTVAESTRFGGSRSLCLDPEPLGDSITSKSGSAPTANDAGVDISGSVAGVQRLNQFDVDRQFNNSFYECGTSTPDMTVVCPNNVQPMPAGEVVVLGQQIVGGVAPDATYRYIYAAVLDSDGDSANDWKPQGAYDWDLFQGADRWYQLERDLTGSWALTVSQVDGSQNIGKVGQSTARAVILGDSILYFVSASEFSLATPTYRMTAFKDRGKFDFADLAADVSKGNPTEPLELVIRPK